MKSVERLSVLLNLPHDYQRFISVGWVKSVHRKHFHIIKV